MVVVGKMEQLMLLKCCYATLGMLAPQHTDTLVSVLMITKIHVMEISIRFLLQVVTSFAYSLELNFNNDVVNLTPVFNINQVVSASCVREV